MKQDAGDQSGARGSCEYRKPDWFNAAPKERALDRGLLMCSLYVLGPVLIEMSASSAPKEKKRRRALLYFSGGSPHVTTGNSQGFYNTEAYINNLIF